MGKPDLPLTAVIEQIDRLIAAEWEITVHRIRRLDDALVLRDLGGAVLEMHLPMIYTPADYAVALHEFGHVHGRYQQASWHTSERWAWQWARENALGWNAEMEHTALMSLAHLVWNKVSIRYAGYASLNDPLPPCRTEKVNYRAR